MKKCTKIGIFLLISGILLLQILAISALANEIFIGTSPHGIAFDGANIWVTNIGRSTVTKLNASDGSLALTYAVDSNNPYCVARRISQPSIEGLK